MKDDSDRMTEQRWGPARGRARGRGSHGHVAGAVKRRSSTPLHALQIPAERLPAPPRLLRASHKVGSPVEANRITNPFVSAMAFPRRRRRCLPVILAGEMTKVLSGIVLEARDGRRRGRLPARRPFVVPARSRGNCGKLLCEAFSIREYRPLY